MSYQRIGTPKAYIDIIQPLLENGTITGTDQIVGTGILTTASSIIQLFDNKPSNAVTIGGNGGTTAQTITIDTNISDNSFTDDTFDLSAGDATVGHDANSKIVAGLKVSGVGITAGTTVASITSTTELELSAVVESGASDDDVTLTFSEATGTLLNETMFVAILGHNFKSADAKFQIQTDHASNFSTIQTPAMTNICNGAVGSAFAVPTTDGWSLITYSQTFDNRYQRLVIDDVSTFDTDIKIGCILWGVVYNFPNAPDMNIKKGISYEGIKINESLGGQKYAHANYLTNSSWVSGSAWSNTAEKSFKTGRHQIDLIFSFLQDTDVFYSQLYNVAKSRTEESIVNRIIMMTNGGMFPLLLQIDSEVATDDDGFLWCRLKNDPSFTQVAHQYWSTQMTFIEEF
tara:strand:+ start:703 stop:1908 length:1206 start_codon:yes stop_codon:yes gene_type:complete